eukprot:5279304-Karenia_brevis.AAC.1
MSARKFSDWPMEQAVGLDMDPQNKTGWRHRRSGPFKDWAEHLRAGFGDEWMEFAINSSQREWKGTESTFVDKLCLKWCLPTSKQIAGYPEGD